MAASIGQVLTMEDFESDDDLLRERPWIKWESTYDAEAWIDNFNRSLKRIVKDPNASGYGICFILEAGGEIYLHTTPDGEVLVDLPPDAEWITPLLAAVANSSAPSTQFWSLPIDKLTQLIMGLSSLTRSARMVLRHDFKINKRMV